MESIINSKKVVVLVAVLVACFFLFKYVRSIYHYKFYSKISVAKFKNIETQNASTYAMYEFYVDGNKIEGATYLRNRISKSLLNKFFRLKYSSKNPNINDILLDQQVTDTVQIRAAGFSFD